MFPYKFCVLRVNASQNIVLYCSILSNTLVVGRKAIASMWNEGDYVGSVNATGHHIHVRPITDLCVSVHVSITCELILICSQLVLRYDTRCYFNVRSKANMSQLNLPHGTDN